MYLWIGLSAVVYSMAVAAVFCRERVCARILKVFEKYSFLQNKFMSRETERKIRLLYAGKEGERQITIYKREKLKMMLCAGVGCYSLIFLLEINGYMNENKIENYQLKRPKAEESEEIQLNVKIGEEIYEKIPILVEKREWSGEEIDYLFSLAEKELRQKVLGKNESFEDIREDLNFVFNLADYGITAQWLPENTDIIGWDGEVKNERLEEAGKKVSLKLILTYKTESREFLYDLTVFPEEQEKEEKIRSIIQQEISDINRETKDEEYIRLPKEIGGKPVSWKAEKEYSELTIGFLGILGVFIVFYMKDKTVEKLMEKRKQQLLRDYPELVAKMVLLTGAGMTVQGAWKYIVKNSTKEQRPDRVRKTVKKNKEKQRYVYEEMKMVYYEMEGGVSEAASYENFGKRCGLPPYLRFSNLLIQNMRKGAELRERLQAEARETFEERKRNAKRKGEEIETKLLLPMTGMLVLVLAILVIPAFAAL
jgi:tight adherence protein C